MCQSFLRSVFVTSGVPVDGQSATVVLSGTVDESYMKPVIRMSMGEFAALLLMRAVWLTIPGHLSAAL